MEVASNDAVKKIFMLVRNKLHNIVYGTVTWSVGMTFQVSVYGKVACISTASGILSSALNAYQTYQVGTLPENAFPGKQIVKFICISESVFAKLVIDTNGKISLVPFKNLSTGYSVMIHECYTINNTIK